MIKLSLLAVVKYMSKAEREAQEQAEAANAAGTVAENS